MNYITHEEVKIKKLVCKHPLVDKIWEYGGLALIPTDNSISKVICLQMIDGTVNTFEDKGDGMGIKNAELFLQNKSI